MYLQSGSFVHTSGIASRLTNSGFVQKVTTSTFNMGWLFEHTGQLNLTAGTLQLSGGCSITGTMDIVSAIQVSAGTCNVDSGSKMQGTGTMTFSGGNAILIGTYNALGDTIVSGGKK